MAADERPPPPTMEGNEPETIAEFQDALAKLELKVSAAEKVVLESFTEIPQVEAYGLFGRVFSDNES